MKLAIRNHRRTLGILALAIFAVVAVAWLLLRPGETPAGQPPLVTVDSASLEALRGDFNRDSSQTRIIVLLSPT